MYKVGSFIEIMSFYDYAHVSALLCRKLSKRTREVTMKWENALNENCKRISVFICDNNVDLFKTHCKVRELKFLNLDLELRRRDVVKSFVDLLQYFKELKDTDIEQFEQLCQQDASNQKLRNYYVAQNYISIGKINTVPLKNNEHVVPMLKELCPRMFEVPVKFLPNPISVSFLQYNQAGDDEEFNSKFVPSEIEYSLKYNPEYDMLNVDLQGSSVDMFLSNTKAPARRLRVSGSTQLESTHAASLWNNPQHSENLQYLHL